MWKALQKLFLESKAHLWFLTINYSLTKLCDNNTTVLQVWGCSQNT